MYLVPSPVGAPILYGWMKRDRFLCSNVPHLLVPLCFAAVFQYGPQAQFLETVPQGSLIFCFNATFP